jgi:hypothetical protein
LIDNDIYINFLDVQYEELVKVKPIKPMVVRAGDLLKTNHNRTNNQLNLMINRKRIKGIREDKIREEEIRKKILLIMLFSFLNVKIQVNGLK